MTEYARLVHAALSEVAIGSFSSSVKTYADARLSEILTAESALRFARELLENDRALADAATRSYTHSNGFDKIALLSSQEPEFKLRLHAWWPNESNRRVDEFVHNHRWTFRSTLLCGRAHVETYRESNDGVSVYRYEYSPRDDSSETYDLGAVGRTSLSSDLMLTLTPGCTYSMGPNLLHRVIPASNSVTVTMFVRWGVICPTASVFADSAVLDRAMLSVPAFTPDQLRTRLTNIIAHLSCGC